ncbi:hypothetical protein [Alteromonas flava]|uniref:hypothetical protein n=1 Tax=Alteromonas flava TaxID=2048003 RepID=UPI000C28D60E|nr:hypothetical protein [Alteromonas flava]
MHNDPFEKQLSDLWLKQSVPEVDAQAVKQSLRKMRRKQRLYAALDVASVVVSLILLLVFRERFSLLVFLALLAVVLFSGIFAGYLLYLRRFVVFDSNETSDVKTHLSSLLRQTQSNIKIARVTQHSCWVSWLVVLAIWGMIGLSGELANDVWARKAGISSSVTFLLLLPMWFWARQRAQKFTQLYAQLKAQQQGLEDARD